VTQKTFIWGIIAIIIIAGTLIFYGRKSVVEKKRIFKVGIVVRGESYRPGVEGFKSKMKELEYEDGRNVVYYTYFVDKRDDLPSVLQEILDKKVDLIHTYSTPATVEAYKKTKSVPIVFGSMGDPLASKTVFSLEKSGTNVTGVNSLSSPLAAKRLEFLIEAIPSVKRVAFPFAPDDIPGLSSYNAVLEVADKLKVKIIPYYISKDRSVKETALAISRRDVDGIVISSDSLVWANLASYVEQAEKEKLPFAVFDKDMVLKGGLLGYGPDYFVTGEQSAVLVDKILRGARPTDLPIEIPRKIILVVNLKTAKKIGLNFREEFLKKANMILE